MLKQFLGVAFLVSSSLFSMHDHQAKVNNTLAQRQVNKEITIDIIDPQVNHYYDVERAQFVQHNISEYHAQFIKFQHKNPTLCSPLGLFFLPCGFIALCKECCEVSQKTKKAQRINKLS